MAGFGRELSLPAVRDTITTSDLGQWVHQAGTVADLARLGNITGAKLTLSYVHSTSLTSLKLYHLPFTSATNVTSPLPLHPPQCC